MARNEGAGQRLSCSRYPDRTMVAHYAGAIVVFSSPPAINKESSGGIRINDWLFYCTFLQTVP